MKNTAGFERKRSKTKKTKKKTKKTRIDESPDLEDAVFGWLSEPDDGDLGDVFVPSEENDGRISAHSYIPMHAELLPVLTPKGLPCGHLIHAAGESDTGKTTFVVDSMARTQECGGLALYGLTEIKFDINRAGSMGVDRNKAVFYKPPHVEALFAMGKKRIERFRTKFPSRPILWVWDSIIATPSMYELDDETKNHNMRCAMAISGEIRRNRHFIDREQVCFVMVNRVYQRQTKSAWEKQTATYGGKAPKGYASIQLEFKRLKNLSVKRKIDGKEVKVPLGIEAEIENTKNHLQTPFQKVQVRIDRLGFCVGGRKPSI